MDGSISHGFDLHSILTHCRLCDRGEKEKDEMIGRIITLINISVKKTGEESLNLGLNYKVGRQKFLEEKN